jgi:hypothetical protein
MISGFPREGLLEDALAQVAGEEQAVGAPLAERSQEAQFSHIQIRRLVDDREVEGPGLAGHQVLGDAAQQHGPGEQPLLGELRLGALEDRPERLALLAADASLAPQVRQSR